MGNGIPVILLHGGGGEYTDEVITFGLLTALVVALTLLAMRRARNKNKKQSRTHRGRRR
jgi:hypothetical protein